MATSVEPISGAAGAPEAAEGNAPEALDTARVGVANNVTERRREVEATTVDAPEGAAGPLEAPQRLQKILSAHGVASRREAEQMIRNGRVTVGGEVAALGQSARIGIDEIAVDGVLLASKEPHVYIMLNKPRGYITTMSDDKGRKTVADLVANVGVRLFPVGRLDMNSEGLLLMTNDGAFANKVAHPSYNKIKVYEVVVDGDVGNAGRLLGESMDIDGHTVRAASVSFIDGHRAGGTFHIAIYEGRNRQVRKMCALCGLRVRSLKRISIGGLPLGELEPGHWRYLTPEEVRTVT
ncbi:MAG: rRNA pseudouridine synthase [Oscillospiraceae bacterium]|nr:rRNA pseudouridine synthase [Oscillospiraceae bacterium]